MPYITPTAVNGGTMTGYLGRCYFYGAVPFETDYVAFYGKTKWRIERWNGTEWVVHYEYDNYIAPEPGMNVTFYKTESPVRFRLAIYELGGYIATSDDFEITIPPLDPCGTFYMMPVTPYEGGDPPPPPPPVDPPPSPVDWLFDVRRDGEGFYVCEGTKITLYWSEP